MNAINTREILNITTDCPTSFELPQSDNTVDGLIIQPKMKTDALAYLCITKDSQSLVEFSGENMVEYTINNILSRYSLYSYLVETIKTFYGDYEESVNALGITYTEHVFRNIQWNTVGETLIIGCAKLGWLFFRKKGCEYRYIRSFCGSKRLGYSCDYINSTDAILNKFRAERCYIKDETHIVFSGYNDEEYWFLYEVDLQTMTVSAFYPIGECCDIQHISSTDGYLVFRPSSRQENHDIEDPHIFWNGQISRCDNTGQEINTMDFGMQKHRGWFPSTAGYGDDRLFNVWYTNDEPSFSELHVLDTQNEKLDVITFENFINIFFNDKGYNLTIIQNNGEALQVYESDILLQKITPVAEIQTTALRSRIRCVGKNHDGILLQIDNTICCISSSGIKNILTGHSFEEYEPNQKDPRIFGLRYLMYDDYYNLMRIYVDVNTMDVVFADKLCFVDSLPVELFDDNGSLDYKRLTCWIRDNNIMQKYYYLNDDIEAFQRHKFHTQPVVDYELPPNQNFWIGNPVGIYPTDE